MRIKMFCILSALMISALMIPVASFADSEDDVQAMFVAYYGRPADPGGFEYWVNRLLREGWSTHFINAFGNSEEYVNRFGGLSSMELVDNLYLQILNRYAESVGGSWYTNLLETGQSSLAEIAVDIAGGVQNNDAITLGNKIYVAHYFTAEVYRTGRTYGTSEIDDAVAIIGLVGNTEESVMDGLAAVDSFISGTESSSCENNCLYEWTLCGIYCGFYQDSTSCRSACLQDYSWCLSDCLP